MTEHAKEFWPVLAVSPGEIVRALPLVANLYERHGLVPHQSPNYLSAAMKRFGANHSVLFANKDVVLALKDRGDGIWESLFPGSPILFDPGAVDANYIREVLHSIANSIEAKAIYFPLTYQRFASSRLLAEVPGVSSWQRSSSPFIDWSDRGSTLSERFRERSNSQARRKERLWSRSLAIVDIDRHDAPGVLEKVDTWSWKRESMSSLLDNGEFEYYASILQSGAMTMSAAMYLDEPIAYRIDALQNNVIYVLEWSYDRRLARLSPGTFLLVKGLVDSWGRSDVQSVDLFGAPDQLKVTLETGRHVRNDLAWKEKDGGFDFVDNLRRERQSHDMKLEMGLADGIGVRRQYEIFTTGSTGLTGRDDAWR